MGCGLAFLQGFFFREKGLPSGSFLENPWKLTLKIEKVAFRVHETTVWYNAPDEPEWTGMNRNEAEVPEVPEVVAASAPRTLPSTRAGGQDDVSS